MDKIVNNKRRFTKNGFTLVELILIIAILGILSAVAIPQFYSMEETAQNSTMKQYYIEIKSAIQMYSYNSLKNVQSYQYPNPSENSRLDTLLFDQCTPALTYEPHSDTEGYFVYTVGSTKYYLKYSYAAGSPNSYSLHPTPEESERWAAEKF
jgi:type IV pilus assembly protein PilA